MQMIVVGCGRMGSELAYRLYSKGISTVVMDISEKAFQNLPADFRGRTVVGDALNRDALERADIRSADGLAAVTSNDALNAVVARVAQIVYQVPTVVVCNFDSHLRPVLEIFGLQHVSASSWGAQRIEEMLHQQETRTVFSAGNGELELYEFTIPAELAGWKLGELLPEQECVLAALTRAGRAQLAEKDFVLQQGDVLLVSATFEGSQRLHANLHNGRKSSGG